MINQASPLNRLSSSSLDKVLDNEDQLLKINSSLFKNRLAVETPPIFPAMVQQQLSLLNSDQSPEAKITDSNTVSKTNYSSLQLATLISEDQLNALSDTEIKALFQQTQDPELKNQLGIEAGTRRKREDATQTIPPSNQTVPNTTSSTQPQQLQSAHPKIGVVVSLDDMNGDVVPVLESFKRLNIPVDLMPLNPKFMEGSPTQIASNFALITENLQKAKELGLNSRQGVHGDKAGVLDKEPLHGTNTSSAAWPSGKDGTETRSNAPYVTQDSVIRGVSCEVNKWGEFNQHNLKSCSISNRPEDQKWLGKATDTVIQNGGVLSMHLHNKHGLANFEETIKRLQASGADFMFLEDLKGKGATVKK